jgi:hypothetical protein
MGCRGKEKVERQFSWAAISRAHIAIYERLMTAAPR